MIKLWRLVNVIDCGSINGPRKIMVSFQIAGMEVIPKDPSLPTYMQFAKTMYWGMLIVWSNDFNEFAESLKCNPTVEDIANKVWTLLELEIEEGEYQGKKTYTVKSFSLAVTHVDVNWGVEPKKFIFSDTTNLQDIAALWFDAKNVKNSDEYQKILNNDDTLLF